jgi:hypothetical protein
LTAHDFSLEPLAQGVAATNLLFYPCSAWYDELKFFDFFPIYDFYLGSFGAGREGEVKGFPPHDLLLILSEA